LTGLFLKYKQVIFNGFILICLVLAAGNFGKDFFLGAASAAMLVRFGESIADLRRQKNISEQTEEKIL